MLLVCWIYIATQYLPLFRAYGAWEKGHIVVIELFESLKPPKGSAIIGLYHCPGDRYAGDNEGYSEDYYACY